MRSVKPFISDVPTHSVTGLNGSGARLFIFLVGLECQAAGPRAGVQPL